MKKKINLKAEISNWFKSDRQFETGKQLFMSHGRNLSFKNILNRGGHTADNFKFLCYELAKMVGIPEPIYKKWLKIPLAKDEAPEVETNINDLPIEKLAAELEVININELSWPVVQQLVKHLDVKPENRKKASMIEALSKARIQKISTTVPDNVKRSFKLREEFPFLKRKDCPGVLKELVADMLTCYDDYVAGHQKLVEGVGPEEMEALSKSVVEDYLENRQIWSELDHYKKTGQILGEHPFFAWINRRDEIRQMKDADLVQLRDQLKNKIPRTKKLIKDEPDHKDTAKREERVTQFEQELLEVNTLLGLEE